MSYGRIEINREAVAKLMEDPTFGKTIDEHAKRMREKVNEKVEESKIKYGEYRETHFEYTESLGNAYKSINVDTFLTADEIFKLVYELFGVDR